MLDRSVQDSYSDGRVFLGRKLFLYGTSISEQYSLIEIYKPFIDELAEEVGERVELNGLVDWRHVVLYVADGKRTYFFPLNPVASAREALDLSLTPKKRTAKKNEKGDQ